MKRLVDSSLINQRLEGGLLDDKVKIVDDNIIIYGNSKGDTFETNATTGWGFARPAN